MKIQHIFFTVIIAVTTGQLFYGMHTPTPVRRTEQKDEVKNALETGDFDIVLAALQQRSKERKNQTTPSTTPNEASNSPYVKTTSPTDDFDTTDLYFLPAHLSRSFTGDRNLSVNQEEFKTSLAIPRHKSIITTFNNPSAKK